MSHKLSSSHEVRFSVSPSDGVSRAGWLGYFMAAVGLGGLAHAEDVWLNYWWVYQDPKPADNTRVIRVIGAKGESYETIYGSSSTVDSALEEHRLQRQRRMRAEALELANQLIAEGKKPRLAYEEAWAEVYRRHWLNADFRAASSLLDDVLARVADSDEKYPFTEEEIRVAMEALMEDDDRLESEEGRLLLENLANRLRAMGMGRGLYVDVNDELMALFKDAMQHGKEGPAAYRDALFKMYRGSIINHQLVGYNAPWGAGLGGRTRYRQAPVKLALTQGSANTSAPQGMLSLSSGNKLASANPFLATSPAVPEEQEKQAQQEDEKEITQGEDSTGPQPVYMGPLNTGDGSRPLMLSMLRAAAPLAEETADLSVNGTAALYFTSDGLTTSGDTKLSRSGGSWSGYTYSVTNYGSYNATNAAWNSISSRNTASYWRGANALSSFTRPWYGGTYTATASGGLSSTLHLIELGSNDKLYLGGADYQGTLRVAAGTTNAYLGSYLPEGDALYSMGKLTGSGTLTLLAHGEQGEASIYTFNDAADDVTWFSGTLKLGASQGGIVELDLGVSGATEAWQNVVFDLTRAKGPGHSTTTGTAAGKTILNVRNHVRLAGLQGGDANSTVTSESGDVSYNLTFGTDGEDYTYGGTFNGRYYISATQSSASPAPLNLIKTGSNTQVFTQELTNNAVNILTVEAGTLDVQAAAAAKYVNVNEGGVLKADSLSVTGTKVGDAELLVAGGMVEVSGLVNVTYDAGICQGGSVTAGSLKVGNILAVDGDADARSSLVVNGATSAMAVQVTGNAGVVTQDLSVTGTLEIGESHAYLADAIRSSLTSTGDLTAGGLRLRADGSLVTGASTSISGDTYLYGGAEWEMTGTSNSLNNGLLKMMNVGDESVTLSSQSTSSGETILTLPGTISFADAGWTNKDQAVFHLDGVTLDFHTGVTITNLGYTVTSGDQITLASTGENGGWFKANSPNVTVHSGTDFYHGTLAESNGNIVINIAHKIDFSKEPFTVGASDVVYIEMYEDASHPALPYLAYDDALYESGAWRDANSPVELMQLMRFSNVKFSEGGHLYMGEDKTLENEIDFRKNRQFGGNIQVLDDGSGVASLHGEINNWGNWLLGGQLSGRGDLTLVAHNNEASGNPEPTQETTTSTENDITTTETRTMTTTVHGVSSTFTFTDTGKALASAEDLYHGTLRIDDYNGGIVQLNVGNVDVAGYGDARFADTLIDLSHAAYDDPATGAASNNSGATLVLGVQGNASLRGLEGEAGTYVVSSQRETVNLPSAVLTVGEQSTSSYTYDGTVGKGNFYLGGEASTVVTETVTTVKDTLTGISSTTTTTTTAQNNFYTSRTGSLSLTKVGTNTQTFSGEVYLDAVQAQGGLLVLGGSADIQSLTIHNGARVDTNNLTLDSATLYGGSAWYSSLSAVDCYEMPVLLRDVYGENGAVMPVTIGSTLSRGSQWTPTMYLNMAGAGTWTAGAGAIFELDNITLNLNKPRVITNMAGISAGSKIALYSGVSGSYSFLDNMVMVEDTDGRFYDADYVLENGTIYLQLASNPVNYGIVINQHEPDGPHAGLYGYVWSGEDNGTTTNDVHYINMTMGNVWRADGSAYNTGWHEQRAVGSSNDDTGVYVNGNTVYFLDTNVHGETETHRLVDIAGKVAPGLMVVNADSYSGHAGQAGAEGQMWYGYAFTSTDGTGSITDNGSQKTSILKTGDALLVLNTANTFSGGIEVQEGGLYLAAPGAAGSGTLTFHTDQSWKLPIVGTNTWGNAVEMERYGAELQICYPHSDADASAFRSSSLTNDIVLTGAREGMGQFSISFAYSSFNVGSSDHENVPRHWRNLTLSGALVGAGYEQDGKWVNTSADDVMVVSGYCSTWNNVRDQSYVTSLTLNEESAGKDAYRVENGEVVNRFAGSVVLRNTVNTSPLPTNVLSTRIAGTVQLVLKGDKLSEAELDLTRESIDSSYDSGTDHRQAYNNILVLNGDATLRGLSANFQGKGYYFPENNGNSGSATRTWKRDMEQMDEVWHVRTLTAGLTTLNLGEYKDVDNSTYIYSGAMGFAQAYASDAEAHIPWGDGFFEHTGEWYFDGHSMAKTNLSITKGSSSTQYIHTACLQDVSVYEGTLGFNNLQLLGNMNLVGGSLLQLGVTGELSSEQTWDASPSSNNLISAYKHVYTSSSVTVEAGKTLTVITPKPTEGQKMPSAATVEGNVTLSEADAANNKAAAALTFVVSGVIPAADDSKVTTDDTNYLYPLLDVKGTFTLEDNTGITISFSGVDFSSESFSDKTYYLAAADNIVIGNGGDSSTFTSRVISLGYGYFGVLDTLDSSGRGLKSPTNRDYLIMTVNGDPRRTWSGMVGLNGGNYTWDATSKGDEGGFDYRWKENLPFKNGQVVLFGNLYQPELWEKEKSDLQSHDTVQVIETLHPGTTIALDESYTLGEQTIYFDIDGYRNSVAGYQKVLVEGEVAPSAIIINSDYQLKKNGTSVFVDTPDATNYYFYGSGQIVNASDAEKEAAGFDASWETMLNKTGKGTAVIELDNRYTGGSVLQGGRVVMKHVNALGYVYNPEAAEDESPLVGNDATITLMNGVMLQGDFDDRHFPGNHDDSASSSLGGFMATTTIRNKVVVNVYADPNDPDYDAKVDGVLINSHDKKLILSKLEGESDTVLELAGVGLSAADSAKIDRDGDGVADNKDNLYRYGVFKVLDPGKFYGTVSMSGHVWGAAADDANALGRVQLDIMSTSKSDTGADWTNATVDLTVNKGTERTVVALDVTSAGEVCELNSINGRILTAEGSSSVLNMSKYNTATLKLTGTRNGDYQGVLGYGDFQVAVDYGGYTEAEHYTTQHHYGAENHGALNVIKEGEGTIQSVRRAWLHELTVKGGVFKAQEALVAHDITAGGGDRVMVGETDSATLYSLSVGKGGTLAMNTTFAESGVKQDAWVNISSGSTVGDSTTKAAWVQLLDGATLSAREDWYTRKQVDIATNAAITINTHNFAIDPYITSENDVFGKYHHAHIIQLLGKFSGRNVELLVNNQLTNPAAADAAVGTSDDSKYMGYVALNDLNGLTGSSTVKVEGMTVLQILGDNGGVEADVDVTVEGRNATLQILDKVTSYGEDNRATLSDSMVQYIDKLTLGANKITPGVEDAPTSGNNDPLRRENNGQLMLGGTEVTTLAPDSGQYLQSPKMADMQVLISSRHNSTSLKGEVSHLHVDLRGAAARLGGTAEHRAEMKNTHIDMARSDINHTLYYNDLRNSLVHLQEDCSLSIEESVLVDAKSEIQGVVVNYDADTVNPEIGGLNFDGSISTGPKVAAGNIPTSKVKEVSTSQHTVVQMTFSGQNHATYTIGSNKEKILVVQTDQFKGVDVTGKGLTIQLYDDVWHTWIQSGSRYMAVQMGGGSGHFLYEVDNATASSSFGQLIDTQFVLQDSKGNQMTGRWVTSTDVGKDAGAEVSPYMLYFVIPEPATATLSLSALAALCARRRRRK